jgi:DNA-binding FadR family transcriptional regulator
MLQYRGTTLADVYQARSILESRAAGLLAARRTRTEIDALEEALAESREAAKDPPRFVHVDERFHLLVVELGGNETLALLVQMLYHIIATANATVTALDTHPPDKALSLARRAHRMHEQLVSLVRDGDPGQAENLWRKHLDGIAKMLTEDMDVQTVLDLLS